MATALVVGNMIGSGAFLLPATLAGTAGPISMLGCSTMCCGSSAHTRISFEAALHRLGGLPIMLRPDELQLGRGEPIADSARVMSSYCSAIVIRTFARSDVGEMAAAASFRSSTR